MQESDPPDRKKQLESSRDQGGFPPPKTAVGLGGDDENENTTIRLAKEESAKLGHQFAGTDQLLIGVLTQENYFSAKILASLGVSPSSLRREVENIVPREFADIRAQDVHLTLLAKRAIQIALINSKKQHLTDVTPDDILLAIISKQCDKGVALRALEILNVDLKKMEMLIAEQYLPKS